MKDKLNKIKDKFISARDIVGGSQRHRTVKILSFFASPLIILFALEVMHLSGFAAIWACITDLFSVCKLFISYIFILSVQSVLFVFLRKHFPSYIITALLFYALSFVTYVMCDVTGDPLLPTDLFLIKNVREISTFASIPFRISYVLSLVIMVFGGVAVWFVSRKHHTDFNIFFRIASDLAIVAIFTIVVHTLCINVGFRHNVLNKINVNVSAFNPIDDLNSNGVILTFFPRIADLVMEEPEEYTFEAVEDVYNRYKDVPSISSKSRSARRPNVIIIQNEAWWDPTNLKNVEFSEDPMEDVKNLGNRYPYGKLVTPSFAGGTCLPEFECVTGYSTAFLPPNSYPYIQHILRDTKSIVSTYKDNGYETVALHPYHINFYSRDSAYPLIGFDRVEGMDDMPDANEHKAGWYVSDDYAADRIISAFENKTKDRIYCFMVTMQNHGAYNPQRYDSYDIEVNSMYLEDDDLQGIRDYTQGVKDASDSFMKLVNYFKKQREPTIIAMYGDHLPLLGTEGSTYKDGGMVLKDAEFNPAHYDELYHTPYIVWANYRIPDFELPEYISASNLGLSILKFSALEDVPWYQSVMYSMYKNYPVYTKHIRYNSNFAKPEGEDLSIFEKDYRLIQQDLLHFRNFSELMEKDNIFKIPQYIR